MVSLSEMFMQGGPFMYVVLLFAALGSVVAMLGGGLGAARVRVPAILWLGAPLLVLLSGAVGELLGLQQAASAVAYASDETRSTLAHAGASVAATTTIFALLMSSVLLGMGAWLAALPAAIAPGEDAKTTALTSTAAAALAALMGLGALVWVLPDFGAATSIGAALVLISPALLIGGVRAGSSPEDQARSAEARVSVALCAVGAVASASAYTYLRGDADCHSALAMAAAEIKMTLVAMGRQQQRFASTAGPAGTLVAAVAGLLAVGPLLRAAFSGRTIASVFAAAAGLLLFGVTESGVLYYRSILAGAWAEPVLLGIQESVPGMPLPQDLDGESTRGGSVRNYDFVVTWPAGASPEPALPLPCPADGLQLIAVATSANTTVSELARQPWCAQTARLDILLAPAWMPEEAVGDPLIESQFLSTTSVLWSPAAELNAGALAQLHQDEAALVLYEKDGRVVLHQAGHPPVVVPTVRAAAEAALERLDQDPVLSRVVVGPTSWSTQELVGLSGTLNRDRWGADRIGLELLAEHTPPMIPATGRGAANNGGAGDTQVLGNLSQEDIQRVLRRHINQIRYCYERELTKDPSLAGRIEIKFVIARDGSVSAATVENSTMNNAAVEACIVSRFRRFRFPEPEGGGIVVVRYPFVFSPE